MRDDLVSEAEAARMFGLHPNTCRKHRMFPEPALRLKSTRREHRLYRKSDVQSAIDNALGKYIDTVASVEEDDEVHESVRAERRKAKGA